MHFPCLKKNIDNFRHECNILTEKSKEKRYTIRFLRKIERMHTKVGEIEHQTAFGLKRVFVCFDSILEVGMYAHCTCLADNQVAKKPILILYLPHQIQQPIPKTSI